MACCTGQTKCNDTVTIGYLKSFIGNDILTTAGTPVSVSTSQPDSYCPTYAELTGGTLIPNFVDGGTNKWASNVDGITINHGSSYSGNQVVKVNDLILTYTRYKSIAVSASSTSLSECGGSTTLGRTFKLTKTIKAMNDCNGGVPSTSSSEGSDSAFTTTYSSTQGWLTINGNTATAPKNGTVSSSTLTTEVKASVNYKGATHTSTGVTVSQAALTGAYETTGTTTPTGMNLIITPSDQKFGCKGGNYTITGTGNYYTRYKWKDSCGVVYNNVYNDVQGSDNVGPYGGTLDVVNCNDRPCDPCYTYDVNVQWSGITSTVTFTQSCQERCEECNSYDEWGSGNGTATAPCEGGSVKVTAEVSGMHYERVYIGDVCRTVSSAETSMVQDINVNIPQNDTDSGKTYTGSGTTSQGGTINYTITQPGGCAECTGAITTTEWSGQTVSAAACDTSKNLTLSGTSTTTYNNCSPKIESVTSAVTVNFSANNTSVTATTSFTFGNATVTVNQAAGPCSCGNVTNAYVYDEITVGCSSADSRIMSAQYTHYTYYSNPACPTESERGANNITIPAVSCNSSAKRTISAGTSADTLANAYPKITQSGGCECGVTCDCDDVTFVTVATTIGSGATPSSGATIARASYGNCTGSLSGATVISPASATTWLSAFTSGNEVRVRATENTELSNERSGTVRTYYRANSSDSSYNCYKDFDVNQISMPCTCESLKYFITPIKTEFGSGGTHGDTILVASGDTFGCGKLSATTLAEIFADENGISPASLITEYLDEKEEKVLFKLRVIEWGSSSRIEWGQEEYKPASVNIYFQPKDESISACTGEAFQVKLYRNKKVQAECNEVTLTTSSITVSCDHRMEGYSQKVASLVPKYSGDTQLEIYRDDRSYIRLSADTNDEHYDWLQVRVFSNANESYINVYITGDNYPSTSARTEVIDYIIVRGEDNKEEITECDRGQIIITQEGCTSGDCSGCSEYGLSIDLSSIPYSGETYYLWDYVTGYSFCDIEREKQGTPYLDMDVTPSSSPYYEFDKSEGTLTVYPNESGESISFEFFVELYRNAVYSHEDCFSGTVYATQETKQDACQCDGWSICQSTRLYPGGIDIQDNKAHSLHLIYRTTSPYTHEVEWDEMSGCGCGVDAIVISGNDWITAPSFEPENSDITLQLAENDREERSGTVKICIRGGSGCLEERCVHEITITQKARYDCSNIMSSQGRINNVVYYGGGPTYTYSYHPASEYADCISGYTTSASSYYANTSYAYDEFGDVIIVVENMRESMGCEDCYVELQVVKNDGSICHYGDRITLNSKCASPSVGTFENLHVSVPSTSSGVTVGTLTNSDIGTSYCLCYDLIADPQYEYFSSIRFEPTNQSGTTNPVNYNIVVDCIKQTDGQTHTVSIGISAKQETCGSNTIMIGTVTVELT